MAVSGGGVPWTEDRSWSMVVSERRARAAALRQSPWRFCVDPAVQSFGSKLYLINTPHG